MPKVDRDELVQRATFAEQAQRYMDMAFAMKSVTETGVELSNNERYLLFIAYKNVLGARRSSWKAMISLEQKIEGSRTQQMASKYREEIEDEIWKICFAVLDLLDMYLIPTASNDESKIYYLKRKGDNFRYLAEIATGNNRNTLVKGSQVAYQDAFKIAKAQMTPTHPIRLSIVINLCILYYDFLNARSKAIQLAHQALDEALDGLETLSNDSVETCNEVLYIFRRNLKRWSSVAQGETDVHQEGGNN